MQVLKLLITAVRYMGKVPYSYRGNTVGSFDDENPHHRFLYYMEDRSASGFQKNTVFLRSCDKIAVYFSRLSHIM